MCTAVAYQNGALYFGRNLDYEVTYGEQVTILPRHFPLHLRCGPVLRQHYAMIGMAHVRDSYRCIMTAAMRWACALRG